MQNKFAWISTPDEVWEDKKEMITTALESGIDHVLDLDDIENIRKLGNVKIIANSDDADIYLVGINGEGDGVVELNDDFTDSIDIANAKKAKSEGKQVCAYIATPIAHKIHFLGDVSFLPDPNNKQNIPMIKGGKGSRLEIKDCHIVGRGV